MFEFDRWFKPGSRSSARYFILRGGPDVSDRWLNLYRFERGRRERYEVVQEVEVEMTPEQSKDFHERLTSWIKTWW